MKVAKSYINLISRVAIVEHRKISNLLKLLHTFLIYNANGHKKIRKNHEMLFVSKL